MQQSKDFVPLHRFFFDENLVLIRVAWYDRQPCDRSRSVGVWLRSGAHLSHVFQLTFNRFQHTGVVLYIYISRVVNLNFRPLRFVQFIHES